MIARPKGRPAPTTALLCLAALPLAFGATPARAHPDAKTSLRRQVADQAEALEEQAAQIRALRRQLQALTAQVADLRRRTGGPAPRSVATERPAPSPTPIAGPPPYELVLAGNWARAITSANARLAAAPDDAGALALKAYALVKYGATQAASGPAARALQLTDGQPTGRARALALIADGAVHEAEGDHNGAVHSFQAAGNSDESLALTYIVFADMYHRKGQDEQAKKFLQAALAHSPPPSEAAAIQQALDGL